MTESHASDDDARESAAPDQPEHAVVDASADRTGAAPSDQTSTGEDSAGGESTDGGQQLAQFLTGNPRRTILLLALPVVAEQFLNFLVGFVDTILSGGISTAATSAVGAGAYVNWLAELIFSLIATGTTALVARHWGARQHDEAGRVAGSSLVLAIGLGLIASAAFYVMAPQFGSFLQLGPESSQLLTRYLRLCCFGHVFSSVLLIGSAALRGSGNMRTPMYVLGLVSILNVVFSSLLANGFGPIPALGVDGIAAGTVAARLIGFVLMLSILLRGTGGVTAKPDRTAAMDFATIARVLRIGIPAAADSLVMWAGHFLFLRVISGLGAEADQKAIFAAHIVAIQVEAINYLPAWAWGMAAATMIGQCLGAGRPDRARMGGHEAMLQACVVAAIVMVVFLVGAESIYALMHKDPAVTSFGVPAIRLLALFEIPLSIVIVYAVGIRGAGESIRPMFINAVGIFLVRLPIGYWLGVELEAGLVGAMGGMGADITVRAIAFYFYFKYGKWTEKGI